MKKNIFDKDVAKELISRVQPLKHDSMPLWGSMTPLEMLHHCNRLNKICLDAPSDNRPSSLRQIFFRIVILYILPKVPKKIKAPLSVVYKGDKTDEKIFEREKKLYIDIIHQFSERKEPIEVNHKLLGRLSMKEWGVFTWMHLDHHLRQFGL
ncbi:MAG: DUF1569 domain-containing protein [Cytophagaceae bacterium]